jgi:hypothetical protein
MPCIRRNTLYTYRRTCLGKKAQCCLVQVLQPGTRWTRSRRCRNIQAPYSKVNIHIIKIRTRTHKCIRNWRRLYVCPSPVSIRRHPTHHHFFLKRQDQSHPREDQPQSPGSELQDRRPSGQNQGVYQRSRRRFRRQQHRRRLAHRRHLLSLRERRNW